MDNPFSYTDYVVDDSFCNRKKEQQELLGYIKNSQNVLLYSHRRFGKTSLIRTVFKHLGKGITPVYIDLYGTTSEDEFINELFKGLASVESTVDMLVKKIKEKFSSIKIDLSIDPMTGSTSLSPNFTSTNKTLLLDEVFGLYKHFSEKKKLVIAFDEFQEIAAYGGDKFEKQIRKIIQGHHNICYIFSGSQTHILHEMFLDEKRALYKMAASFPLQKISHEHYIKWITDLFAKANRSIDRGFIRAAVDRCEGHPLYVQQLFYSVWEQYDSIPDLNSIFKTMIMKHESEFITLWDTLTLNQKKVLKLICYCKGKGLYYADHLNQFGFRTGSQVLKAVTFLENKGIIAKNGEIGFQDILFKHWVQQFL